MADAVYPVARGPIGNPQKLAKALKTLGVEPVARHLPIMARRHFSPMRPAPAEGTFGPNVNFKRTLAEHFRNAYRARDLFLRRRTASIYLGGECPQC